MRLPVNGPFGFGPQRRWGYNLADSTADYGEEGLKEMCDHGAKEVERGRYDAVRFSVMDYEADFVKRYMAKKHPNVRFYFDDWRLSKPPLLPTYRPYSR